MSREQRLVFGEVGELYDRHRPAHPGVVVRRAGLALGHGNELVLPMVTRVCLARLAC
jgi:hypothetical protein